MKISYIKNSELCVETRNFLSLIGSVSSHYDTQTPELIRKFSLPPSPLAGQKDQYHVLCGDGVWRDIRTMQS